MVYTKNGTVISKDPDRVLRSYEVVALTGLSRTTIWRLERRGEFPARRHISSFAVGWILSEVNEWLKSREAVQLTNN